MKITATGLSETISFLEEFGKQIPNKEEKMLTALADIGVKEASAIFANAIYSGTNDAEVSSVSEAPNKVSVVASGESVAFIEYGTGVTNTYPEHPYAAEKGAIRGGFGRGRGANPKGWVYRGDPGNSGYVMSNGAVLTYGDPAAMPMYAAEKAMRFKLNDIAEEAFK